MTCPSNVIEVMWAEQKSYDSMKYNMRDMQSYQAHMNKRVHGGNLVQRRKGKREYDQIEFETH